MFVSKYITRALLAGAVIGLASCSKQYHETVSSAAYTPGRTVCMGVEGDGHQTLRAWGKGSNEADATEQAKKNAVYDVIFKGIQGSGECSRDALVNEVNARERYAAYFDPFFADGGEYRNFVKEEKDIKPLRAKGSSIVNIGPAVTVDRTALRRQLIADGILKPAY